MKKITRTILLLSMLTVVVASCKEDEDEPAAKTNFFTLDGNEYSLSQAISFENGVKDNAFEFELIMASSGVDFSNIDDIGIAGKGDLLYLNMLSSSKDGIADGTYTFSNSATRNPNTYNELFMGVNYENQTEESDVVYSVGSGEVTVKVEGDIFTIEFNLTVGPNKLKMAGSYTGKITNYLD